MVPLQALVEEWLRLDQVNLMLSSYICFSTQNAMQNPITRSDIQTLWCAGNTEELEKRMR